MCIGPWSNSEGIVAEQILSLYVPVAAFILTSIEGATNCWTVVDTKNNWNKAFAWQVCECCNEGDGNGERKETQHPGDLGRRHRHLELELLQPRLDGLSDAQHRPHCQRRHDVHRFLRRAKLHGGPLGVHYGTKCLSHRPFKSRRAGGTRRHDRKSSDDRGLLEESGLCNRPVRQESSGRPEPHAAHQSWLRRILRQSVSLERRGRAGDV